MYKVLNNSDLFHTKYCLVRKPFVTKLQCFILTYDYLFYTYFANIGPTCATEEPLVDGNIPLPDGQITATSLYGSDILAYKL